MHFEQSHEETDTYTDDEIKEIREKFRGTANYNHFIVLSDFQCKMNKQMTAEQAVFIGSAVNDLYQVHFYMGILENLSNPHDLIPLIIKLNALTFKLNLKKIQGRVMLLSKMGLIEPPPERGLPELMKNTLAAIHYEYPGAIYIVVAVIFWAATLLLFMCHNGG